MFAIFALSGGSDRRIGKIGEDAVNVKGEELTIFGAWIAVVGRGEVMRLGPKCIGVHDEPRGMGSGNQVCRCPEVSLTVARYDETLPGPDSVGVACDVSESRVGRHRRIGQTGAGGLLVKGRQRCSA